MLNRRLAAPGSCICGAEILRSSTSSRSLSQSPSNGLVGGEVEGIAGVEGAETLLKYIGFGTPTLNLATAVIWRD